MIVLSNRDIAQLLPMATAIEIVEKAMIAVSAGKANLPLRSIVDVGVPNRMGIMPGAMTDPACYGVKLVSLFPDNPAQGLSSHSGAMVLFEAEHGRPIAMMSADLLTAVRTAAASAVATRALSRPNAAILAVVGTGEQAEHHIEAMLAVRDLTEIRVIGRNAERAERLVARFAPRHRKVRFEAGTDIRQGIGGADIVCTVTAAATPILLGDWLAPGMHLNAVGSSVPAVREIDERAPARSALFVDYRPSALAQAGEIINAIEQGLFGPDHIRAEIGEVLAGNRPGRQGDEDITLYRSLGIAAQDIACAEHCWRLARKRGLGLEAELD